MADKPLVAKEHLEAWAAAELERCREPFEVRRGALQQSVRLCQLVCDANAGRAHVVGVKIKEDTDDEMPYATIWLIMF